MERSHRQEYRDSRYDYERVEGDAETPVAAWASGVTDSLCDAARTAATPGEE